MAGHDLLIPRDIPIDEGRVLRFSFKVDFDVPLTDAALSLAEVEEWFGGPASEALWRALATHYERNVVEHTVTLADTDDFPPTGVTDPDGATRFEVDWEQRERLAGKAGTWSRSRRWLNEIPASKAGASEEVN